MKAEIKGKDLIVTIPLEEDPEPSKSGKNIVIASTGGNVETDLKFKGQTVKLGLNAYIKNKK